MKQSMCVENLQKIRAKFASGTGDQSANGNFAMCISQAIKGALMVLATMSLLAQIGIDASIENVACACIVYASSMAVFLYISWSGALERQPLSTFVVLGFCVTTHFGALVAQSLALTPLTFALYDPLYTFGTLAFYQFVIIVVHWVHCNLSLSREGTNSVIRKLLRSIGVYSQPSVHSLWLMGIFGLFGMFFAQSPQAVLHGVGNGLTFLAWGPYLIPVYAAMQPEVRKHSGRSNWKLLPYTVIVILLNAARGHRSEMLLGVVTISLLYLLIGLQSNKMLTGRAVVRFSALVIVGAILLKPLTTLATAVEIARQHSGTWTPLLVIDRTVDIVSHPSVIDSYKAQNERLQYLTPYDETYFSDSFARKMLETKFIDNALHFGRMINDDSDIRRLWSVTGVSLLAILPTPMIDALHLYVDKDELGYSMGDYLFYLAKGGALGGERTGSLFGQGLALFGIMFPFVYALACLAFFHLMALLTIRQSVSPPTVAAPAMMSIWWLFQHGVASDSFQSFLAFLLRGFVQIVLIYCIMLGVSALVFGRRRVFGHIQFREVAT